MKGQVAAQDLPFGLSVTPRARSRGRSHKRVLEQSCSGVSSSGQARLGTGRMLPFKEEPAQISKHQGPEEESVVAAPEVLLPHAPEVPRLNTRPRLAAEINSTVTPPWSDHRRRGGSRPSRQ
jgi:hypothetical protein